MATYYILINVLAVIALMVIALTCILKAYDTDEPAYFLPALVSFTIAVVLSTHAATEFVAL